MLKNAQIVNVFTQSVETGDIAIEGGYIVGIGNYEGITDIEIENGEIEILIQIPDK